MLPEGWKEERLSELLKNKTITVHIDGNHGSFYPKKEEFVSSGVPYISANCIQNGRIDFQKCKFLAPEKADKLQKGIAKDGDVLFAHNATVGPVALLKTNEERIILSTTLTLYRCDPIKLNNSFLYQYMSSTYFDTQYESIMRQTTRNQVPITAQREFVFLLPPLPEQKKIAAILSTWDRAIEGLGQLLANSQQQKKALMQQLLTGKKRLPGFTGEWKKVSLEKTGKIVSGGTPDTTVPAYWDGDVLWLTPTDVTSLREKYVDDTKRKITQAGIKDSATTLLPAGSLLVCTRATIGYMAIAKKPITTNQGFKNIVFNKLFLPEFVYYFLCTQKHEMQRLASGSTFAEISKKDFCKIHISAPPLPEQKAIAAVLSTADEEITALESDLLRLRQEKKALMQQLLTGKRRVTVD